LSLPLAFLAVCSHHAIGRRQLRMRGSRGPAQTQRWNHSAGFQVRAALHDPPESSISNVLAPSHARIDRLRPKRTAEAREERRGSGTRDWTPDGWQSAVALIRAGEALSRSRHGFPRGRQGTAEGAL